MASRQLRVLESYRVAPPPGSAPEASTLPLTFLDVPWLYMDTVERVFFYRFPHPTSHFLECALGNLKSSLSLTLRHFYPLAGRLRRVPGSEDRHEIHYGDGDSVAFAVAECEDEDFGELSGSRARDATRLRPLVPRLPRSPDARPLLAIQATVFPNNGVAIGVAVHHAACDGSSSTHFVSSWAACCRSGGSAAPVLAPIFDRTLIHDPHGLYSFYSEWFSRAAKRAPAEEPPGNGDAQLEASGDTILATFTFSGDRIKRLKGLALAKAAPETFHCSSITVAFAYAWACHVKARRYESERNCIFGFVTNCRSRLRPPVPEEYFGNCLSFCIVEAKAGDLTGEDGFVVAAKAVGKSIESCKKGEPLVAAGKALLDEFSRILPQQPLTVAGSPHFKVYSFDFGWGRPRKVEIVSIARSITMSVAESSEGGGGLEIGFVLPKHEMDEFIAHFHGGFEDLLQ